MDPEKIHRSSLIITSLLAAVGAIIYKIYRLDTVGIFLAAIISLAVFAVFAKKMKVKKERGEQAEKMRWPLLSTYIAFFMGCWVILFMSRTSEALISPWQAVPWYFFACFFASTLVLVAYLIRKGKASPAILCFHSFLAFSILWTVYKLGYGYDPFIHEASMKLIKKEGVMDPKPWYYLGQYSLVLILNRLAFIPIGVLNRLLVPAAAAFLMAPSIYFFAKRSFKNKKVILLSMLSLLVLPFSLLSLTTPQNLSYILLIIVIFSALAGYKIHLVILLSAATFLVHPLAGIPAALFTAAFYADTLKAPVAAKIVRFSALVASVIALPASFFASGRIKGLAPFWENLRESPFTKPFLIPDSKNPILNFAHFLGHNAIWGLLILALISFIFVRFNKQNSKNLILSSKMSFAFLASYFLAQSLDFKFLINYERSDYPERILVIAAIFILPCLLSLFYFFIKRLLEKPRSIKYTFLVFICLAITASLYYSYPRKDAYLDSRSFSVSDSDIKAVSYIENNSPKKPYAVLANQQVSVAALKHIGFRYLDNGMFFYPIPTGGRLYQYYLDMVYEEANRKTMLKAMDLAEVDLAYFVINEYWWAFDKIIKEAELSANSYKKLDDGRIYIFKYER